MNKPAIAADTVPALARTYRFQWEEAQKAHVLLYPEGMVKLSESAAEILKLCDGSRSVADIVATLQARFQAGPKLETDVHDFLTQAYEHGWLS